MFSLIRGCVVSLVALLFLSAFPVWLWFSWYFTLPPSFSRVFWCLFGLANAVSSVFGLVILSLYLKSVRRE